MIYCQIQDISIGIVYDSENSWYDCFMTVIKGSTSEINTRLQLGSQITIVTDVSDSISIAKSHNPLFLMNGQAADWQIGTILKGPSAAPNSTYWSIAPSVSPATAIPVVKEGESFK